MFNDLFKRKHRFNDTCTKDCGVTSLVVNSALNLTKEIEEKAKQLRLELLKLEDSRIEV